MRLEGSEPILLLCRKNLNQKTIKEADGANRNGETQENAASAEKCPWLKV